MKTYSPEESVEAMVLTSLAATLVAAQDCLRRAELTLGTQSSHLTANRTQYNMKLEFVMRSLNDLQDLVFEDFDELIQPDE